MALEMTVIHQGATSVSGHTYLLKSRHGVYYYRAVVPKDAREQVGRREVRVSLRTKDRATAKRLVALRALMAGRHFGQGRGDHDNLECLYLNTHELTGLEPLAGTGPDSQRTVIGPGDMGTLEGTKNRCAGTAAARAARQQDVTALTTAASSRAQVLEPIASLQGAPHQTRKPFAPALDDHVETTIERFVANKTRTTSAATAEKYGAQCRVFLKIVSHGRKSMRISELAPQHLRAYVDTLPKLPPRIESADERSIEDILKMPGTRLSAKTIFAHAQATNMFLAWCEAQQYPLQSNFHSILRPLLKKPRIKARNKAFSQDHLKTLFGSDDYRAGAFKRASDYWVPLLGLFTGAREAELCQLDADDVRQDASTGIWLLDINSDQDKRLKTDASKREIPIHPVLCSLGFLEFVNTARADKDTRLFKDEQRNKRGEFSAFSKRFNRYKEGLGIASDAHQKLDFHSFRHTLQTLLFEAGEEEYVVNALCGHTPAQQSEGVRTYSRGPGLKAKHEVLLKLEFGIDLDSVKPNGWSNFWSAL